MKKDFLTWTREHEEYTGELFTWKNISNGSLNVLGTGIVEFLPKEKTGTQIIYSCGIHGNETGPIEIVNDIVKSIENESLTCIHHTLFIFGNPRAMNIGKRFTVENLNRLFARELDSKQDNYEVRRAKELIQIVDDFYETDTSKIHYDLHTAIRASELKKFAIYPYSLTNPLDKEQLGFLDKSEIEGVIITDDVATTFSYHSSSLYNAASFTLELGKVKKFGENDRDSFKSIEENLRLILSGEYTPTTEYSKLKIFEMNIEIIKHDDTFTFNFDEKFPNFSKFKDGELISKDKTKTIKASGNDQRVIFPNPKVKIGERAALIIGPKRLP